MSLPQLSGVVEHRVLCGASAMGPVEHGTQAWGFGLPHTCGSAIHTASSPVFSLTSCTAASLEAPVSSRMTVNTPGQAGHSCWCTSSASATAALQCAVLTHMGRPATTASGDRWQQCQDVAA